jgi:hypothetical protein
LAPRLLDPERKHLNSAEREAEFSGNRTAAWQSKHARGSIGVEGKRLAVAAQRMA